MQIADLTGLYEGRGEGERRSRICMIARADGIISFGLVAWTADGGACSGSGEVERQGEALRLTMAGNEQCLIEARMVGSELALATSVPQGCAYYCSPGAGIAGERFRKTGGTAAAALRATDLAGDPLCG